MTLRPSILLVFLLLAGCASPTGRLDSSAVAQIRAGLSRSEVEALLSRPKSEVKGSNGKRVYLYHSSSGTFHRDPQSAVTADPDRPASTTTYSRATGQHRQRVLSVLFGTDDRVEAHHFYESTTDVAATVASTQVGKPVRADRLRFIFNGSSERRDLVNLFGPPLAEILEPGGNLLLSWLCARGNSVSWGDMEVLEVLVSPAGTVLDHRVVQQRGRL